MKTKRLGNSDLLITPVGFGAWAIGGSGWKFGWGDQDDKQSLAAIHRRACAMGCCPFCMFDSPVRGRMKQWAQ